MIELYKNFYLNDMYVFPYDRIPRNAKVVLYGAGEVGKCLHHQISRCKWCQIIAWVDRNADKYQDKRIIDPALFFQNAEDSFEYIIIAVNSSTIAREIQNHILNTTSNYSLKIVWCEYNINKIRRQELLAGFSKRLKNRDFTIISQNCIGGVMYHDLGMQFLSPTINLFIEDDNFIKLVKDLKHYLSITPRAKVDKYVSPLDSEIKYPIISIDDIDICCLHYTDCISAIEAWEKRKKRVNYDNVFVIGNSWNMHDNPAYIKTLCEMNNYNTIVFTDVDYDYSCCIKLPDGIWEKDVRGIVRPNLTDFIPGSYMRYYEVLFDYVSWLDRT